MVTLPFKGVFKTAFRLQIKPNPHAKGVCSCFLPHIMSGIRVVKSLEPALNRL
jgi:hypothetical protein